MKSSFLRTFVAAPVVAALLLPLGLSAQTASQSDTTSTSTTTHRRVISQRHTAPKQRSKKKSAMIIGGTGLAGAGIGALAGGKKGAVIGGLAGAGTGYVYDRKTQKKPVIPK